jgi:hypothetical protein
MICTLCFRARPHANERTPRYALPRHGDAACIGTRFRYGFGHFRSPPLAGLARHCRLKTGVVSTSDSLDATAGDLELLRAEGAAVKEMEAAAVAWVCQQVRTPFFALKSITDIVDAGDGDSRDSTNDSDGDDNSVSGHRNQHQQQQHSDGSGNHHQQPGRDNERRGSSSQPRISSRSGSAGGSNSTTTTTGSIVMESAGTTREQFERNLAKASASLQAKLVLVLQCLAGHSLADWRTTTPRAFGGGGGGGSGGSGAAML